MRTFGCAADGRLFRGARGGPLSESLYGRIWHQARAAAMPEDGTGTQPVRRPFDLRHAALSLWLASDAPPAEVAARAGHSVHVLLSTYAHCIPGHDQIASQHIEQALRPSHWPPAGPQKSTWTPGFSSVMRPCHSWTQRDATGPETSGQSGEIPVTCGNTGRRDQVHGLRPRRAALGTRPAHPADQARSGPPLAHSHRERSAEPLPDTHQARLPGTPAPGLT